ncbi:hypothetical protein D3C72_2373290 [compost metagenome]
MLAACDSVSFASYGSSVVKVEYTAITASLAAKAGAAASMPSAPAAKAPAIHRGGTIRADIVESPW